jgi:hypothetical protein
MKSKQKHATPFLKTKPITTAFATIALLAGAFFLNQSSLTGNAITTSDTPAAFLLLPFIGLLLIACAIILAVYTVRKR